MTTVQFKQCYRAINMILSAAILAMTVSLVLLFALAPGADPAHGLEQQELKVIRYSQAD